MRDVIWIEMLMEKRNIFWDFFFLFDNCLFEYECRRKIIFSTILYRLTIHIFKAFKFKQISFSHSDGMSSSWPFSFANCFWKYMYVLNRSIILLDVFTIILFGIEKTVSFFRTISHVLRVNLMKIIIVAFSTYW